MARLPRGFRGVTVGALKKALADIPDDTFVLKPGSDHSYTVVGHAALADVEQSDSFEFFEYYGRAGMREHSTVIKAFVVEG